MTKKEIKKIINPLFDKFLSSQDKTLASAIQQLLNLVEQLAEDNENLKNENQKLKDEINKLKGEQGKPKVKKSKKEEEKEENDNDHSSEKERNSRKPKKPRKPKKKRKAALAIDRTERRQIDAATLPTDAVFKGHEIRIIQDIKIVTDNVKFECEVYYSPSQKRSYIAGLPAGYHGDFGPGIRALTVMLYHEGDMTQPGIHRFYDTFNIAISPATISRMLTNKHESFHQEKDEIVEAGRQATRYQGLDDTSARVNGQNHHTFILCSPFYAAYFTLPKKDRLTVLRLLCRGQLFHQFTPQTEALLVEFGLPDKSLKKLQKEKLCPDSLFSSEDCHRLFDTLFPGPRKYATYKRYILEASAIVYYRNSSHALDILMSDDAPQFQLLALHQALCWIHALRHYKKLKPLLKYYQQQIDDFLEKAWDFYQKLLNYKDQPDPKIAEMLRTEFDSLFSIQTGYESLDARIAITRSKKEALLLVLTYPFIPLHNNDSELGARKQARYRDIHLQNKNEKGVQAKDTFMTLSQTARKLSVNFYYYLHDRITKKFQMPSLASLITQKSQLLHNSS